MVKIDVDRRLKLVDKLLDSTKRKVENCDLSPLDTPSLLEYFGSMSGNLMLLDVAIHEGGVEKEKISKFEKLRSRYNELERNFTNKCDCRIKTKKWEPLIPTEVIK